MLERRGRSEEEVTGRGSSFILPAEEMKNGGVFVLRAEKVEDGSFSFFGERSPSSFFRPIFDPLFGAEDRRRVGSSSIFGSEDRRLKRGEVFRSSTPKIEDGGGLRSSASKNEERREKGFSKNIPFFEEAPLFFEETFFFEECISFFVFRVRRSKSPPFFDLAGRRLGRRSPWASSWRFLGRESRVAWFREQRTPRCVFFRNDALSDRGEHKSYLKDHSREGCDLRCCSVRHCVPTGTLWHTGRTRTPPKIVFFCMVGFL